VVFRLANQSEDLARAQRDLKDARKKEEAARKAFEATPSVSNASAKDAWNAAKRNVSDAEAVVDRRQSEYDQSVRGQARGWL
jgi:hypothetical protein